MLRSAVFACSLLLVFSLVLPGNAFANKEKFVEAKCVKCHSVSSLSIETTKKDKSKAVDLSNAGSSHDAAFLKDYLMRNVEHTAHDGFDGVKKHKQKFKGSDEELQAMVDWLTGLKK